MRLRRSSDNRPDGGIGRHASLRCLCRLGVGVQVPLRAMFRSRSFFTHASLQVHVHGTGLEPPNAKNALGILLPMGRKMGPSPQYSNNHPILNKKATNPSGNVLITLIFHARVTPGVCSETGLEPPN